MRRYTIKYNYKASIVVEVFANDEGEALELGRNKAEESDIDEFSLCGEMESQILRQE